MTSETPATHRRSANLQNTALDDALDRLRGFSPELRDGTPNHGPMAAQALVALGCGELASAWADRYRAELDPGPSPRLAIAADAWHEALGWHDRFADWHVFFGQRLAGTPWTDLLTEWLPRLLPGAMAYGSHGAIRTAHAARALAVDDTALRRDELAAALATWAAYYQVLPGTPTPTGTRQMPHVLQALPHLAADVDRSGPPPSVVRQLDSLSGFASAVGSLAPAEDIAAALSTLGEVGARLYVANAERHPLVFLHAVTGPVAVRRLLPYLPPHLHPTAFAYAWQVVAAWAAAFAANTEDPAVDLADEPLPVEWSDVIGRAVETGDQHAIKLTEASLSEADLNRKPVYLRVALDWTTRMTAARDWSRDARIAAGLATV